MIRRLVPGEEAEACARLMCSSEPWITLQRDYAESMRVFENPQYEIYVSAEGGRLAGFIMINVNGDFAGYIKSICVAPEQRGSGIGTELIRFAEERIFRQHPNVFMLSSSFNPRARALYERLGYRMVGEITDYIVRGHSEVLLRKTLGPIREFGQSFN
ncbi:MAG TPA: GNAT family N-acetyltransferase, partial [Bryobacteraceae bacterium]|nr:GNAT family N-acetyltransferase [Bryobacteraceae bacterium]